MNILNDFDVYIYFKASWSPGARRSCTFTGVIKKGEIEKVCNKIVKPKGHTSECMAICVSSNKITPALTKSQLEYYDDITRSGSGDNTSYEMIVWLLYTKLKEIYSNTNG